MSSEQTPSPQENEELLRMAIDAANVGTWHVDLIRGIDTHDASLNRILGFEAVRTVRRMGEFMDNIHPDDRPLIELATQAAVDGGGMYQIQHRIIRPDGQVRWLHDRGKVFYDAQHKPIYMTGAATDITEQKENEERISQLLERQREHTARMVQLSETSLLINENLSVEKVLQILTKEARKIIPSHQCISRLTINPHEPHSAISLSDHYKQKNPEKFWHDIPYQDVCIDNEPMRIIGKGVKSLLAAPLIGRDGRHMGFVQLTHKKEGTYNTEDEAILMQLGVMASTAIENARLYSERLAADERKDTFLANMSHEIRTPMNAVIGLATILSASKPLTDEQRNYIDTLQFSATSLLQLLNDMLDISKLEKESFVLEHIPFHLNDLVAQTANLFSGQIRAKNIRFDVETLSEQDDLFYGDPTRIGQIMTNLISNAVKFTEKGRITVKLSAQDYTDINQSSISLTVQDTGIGIPQDMIDAVFDRFTQVDPSITRKYGGTGLGLSICRDLARIMAGDITATSILGAGSVFVLNLTLEKVMDTAQITVKQKCPELEAPSNSQMSRVLIVEDNEANILVATTLIGHMGHRFDVASRGADVLQRLPGLHMDFDVILMDIQMPDMDGFEITRHIRDYEMQNKMKPIKIIATTAHALIGYREKCLENGMDDYLSKPFNQAQLMDKLGSVSS